MAHVEDGAKEKARLEWLVITASEWHEQHEELEASESKESEGSAPEELDTRA